MPPPVVGLLHPGEMGAAVGARLREAGHEVRWASAGRSAQTARRARAAGLVDAGTVAALADGADLVLSICLLHAAREVAAAAGDCRGLYADCNAIAPVTVRALEELLPHARLVDGGIVGPPPETRARTRLYVSGPAAEEVRDRLEALDVRVVLRRRRRGLRAEDGLRGVDEGDVGALPAARGWRGGRGGGAAGRVGDVAAGPARAQRERRRGSCCQGLAVEEEMRQIDGALAAAGLPAGFGGAAAEVYARAPREGDLDAVLGALRRPS